MPSTKENVGELPLPVPKTGRSFPIGATLVNGGANFSVFSRSAASIELLLFDRMDDARPSRIIPMDPSANRTYHYWHVCTPILGFPLRSIASGHRTTASLVTFEKPLVFISSTRWLISSSSQVGIREWNMLSPEDSATAVASLSLHP